jgi:hypothetical protein
MTEADWLASSDLKAMPGLLREQTSERKLRLFALACCGRIDRLITGPRSRAAVEFADRHADLPRNRRKGIAAVRRAAHAAWQEAYARLFTAGADHPTCLVASNAADAASATVHEDAWLGAGYAAAFAAYAVGWGAMPAGATDLDQALAAPEHEQQGCLLRDIVGNPFRPVRFEDRWRDRNASACARAIYEERAFDRLPILADALEDAGCAEPAILEHCREQRQHVRGCWVLDSCLGLA